MAVVVVERGLQSWPDGGWNSSSCSAALLSLRTPLPCDEGRWPSTLQGAERVKEDRAWEVDCP